LVLWHWFHFFFAILDQQNAFSNFLALGTGKKTVAKQTYSWCSPSKAYLGCTMSMSVWLLSSYLLKPKNWRRHPAGLELQKRSETNAREPRSNI